MKTLKELLAENVSSDQILDAQDAVCKWLVQKRKFYNETDGKKEVQIKNARHDLLDELIKEIVK